MSLPEPRNLSAALSAALRPRLRDANAANPEGVANSPDELVGLPASLHILCKDTADLLTRHYPGFLWAVQPDLAGLVVNIFCLNFHDTWGYTIKVIDLDMDPNRREVVRAGAELLRRFRYPGTRYSTELANAVPRGADGKAIPDLSDFAPSRRRAQSEAELAIAEGRGEIVDLNGERFLAVKPT